MVGITGGESIGTAVVRIIGDGEGLRDGINDDLDDLDGDMEDAGERHSKKYKKGFDRDMEKDNGFFRRIANRFETLSVPLGRLFGKGSRNNFLNFFGSVVTNILNATGHVVDFFATVVSGFKQIGSIAAIFFKSFVKQADEATTFAERFAAGLGEAGLTGSMTTLLTGGLNLVAGLVALAAAIVVAAISAGALVSVFVLLTGVIVALASTISFALIGAVAAFLPLIVPLAGIVAGVVAAVQMFKNAGDKLKPSIAALNKEASGLWKTFRDKALKNAPRLLDRVTASMGGLDKFMASAGEGFRNFAKAIVDSVTGPEFKKFTNVFSEFLPSASRKLGIIFGNTFEGLAGLLEAAIPSANKLLNWLIKITDKFSEWVNSPKGQEQIKGFLDRAASSAQSLWHFLKEAFGLIGDFLAAGQGTGDSIFDSMADALARVRQFFKENPTALSDWFRDAEHFAHTLGHAIESITKAIDAIDTPETRKVANFLIRFLANTVEQTGLLIGAFTAIGGAFVRIFTGIVEFGVAAFRAIFKAAIVAVTGIIDLLAKIPGPGGRAARAIQGAFDNMSDSVNGQLDDIEVGIHGLEVQANNFNPTMDINTQPAVQKLTFLGTLAAQIQHAIANANAAAAAHGPGRGNTSSPTSGGSQPIPGEGAPNGSKIAAPSITIVTPTTDPAAVATELLNRLAVVGY